MARQADSLLRWIDSSFWLLRRLTDTIAPDGGGTVEGLIHRYPTQLRIGLLGDAERPCLPRSLCCLPQLGQAVGVDQGRAVKPPSLESAARRQPTQPAH